ncbi:MAG: hypothetical protein ACJ70Z_04920 [Nitrososphaera sp.]
MMDYSQVEHDVSIATFLCCRLPLRGAKLGGTRRYCATALSGGTVPFTGPGINIGSGNNSINIKAITIPPRKSKCLLSLFLSVLIFLIVLIVPPLGYAGFIVSSS